MNISNISPYWGFHSHGCTPSSLDALFHGKSEHPIKTRMFFWVPWLRKAPNISPMGFLGSWCLGIFFSTVSVWLIASAPVLRRNIIFPVIGKCFSEAEGGLELFLSPAKLKVKRQNRDSLRQTWKPLGNFLFFRGFEWENHRTRGGIFQQCLMTAEMMVWWSLGPSKNTSKNPGFREPSSFWTG